MPILEALRRPVEWLQPKDGVHWSFLEFSQAFLELRLQLFLALVLDWQSSNTCRNYKNSYNVSVHSYGLHVDVTWCLKEFQLAEFISHPITIGFPFFEKWRVVLYIITVIISLISPSASLSLACQILMICTSCTILELLLVNCTCSTPTDWKWTVRVLYTTYVRTVPNLYIFRYTLYRSIRIPERH